MSNESSAWLVEPGTCCRKKSTLGSPNRKTRLQRQTSRKKPTVAATIFAA
jgi:hypothetical protein